MAVPRTQPPQQDLEAEGDRLYEQFGKPLEADHWGELVAIGADGRTLLGADFDELVRRAKQTLGPGNFIFRVGSRAVGSV